MIQINDDLFTNNTYLFSYNHNHKYNNQSMPDWFLLVYHSDSYIYSNCGIVRWNSSVYN